MIRRVGGDWEVLNGGTCFDFVNECTCRCDNGWTGANV